MTREPARAQGEARPLGDPTVAALLAWFLPGAGHLYLARPALAAAGFAVVGGLYWLGLQLAHGMTFEYLDPELRSPFAPALSPELGNLGGLIWQIRAHGFGEGYPRPFPEWIRLGSQLTALSGVLNVVLAVHAHLLARTGDPLRSARPARDVLLGWLVPGLGHWLQGRRLRGILVFATLVGLFVLGTVLAEATNLSRERHFYYWAGQFLLGLPALAAEALFGGARVRGPIPLVEAGLVYGCVAGLLNVLAMIDVYSWSEARTLGLPVERHAPARPTPEPARGPAKEREQSEAPA